MLILKRTLYKYCTVSVYIMVNKKGKTFITQSLNYRNYVKYATLTCITKCIVCTFTEDMQESFILSDKQVSS